jgi:hypothetical protein
VVLAIGHTLRAHQALGRPDALPGFLEVVHRLVKDGDFAGHDRSIRVGILRSLDLFAFSREQSTSGSVSRRSERVSPSSAYG